MKGVLEVARGFVAEASATRSGIERSMEEKSAIARALQMEMAEADPERASLEARVRVASDSLDTMRSELATLVEDRRIDSGSGGRSRARSCGARGQKDVTRDPAQRGSGTRRRSGREAPATERSSC